VVILVCVVGVAPLWKDSGTLRIVTSQALTRVISRSVVVAWRGMRWFVTLRLELFIFVGGKSVAVVDSR